MVDIKKPLRDWRLSGAGLQGRGKERNPAGILFE